MKNLIEAKFWYFTVNQYCRDLEVIYDVPLIKVAAILAALSPQNKFDQNLIDLENFLESGGTTKASTFGGQRDKAFKILHSKGWSEKQIIDCLGKGLKTLSFFDNIYRPDSSLEVTVDLWQIRWAKKLDIIPQEGTLTNKRYNKIRARVRKYAKRLGIMPHQFQAITWTQLRGEAW